MKKIVIILIAVSFLACANEGFTKEEAVDIGNNICPVMGESIAPESNITYEYQGKIYHFCCTACIELFKQDPQKYIKKVEEEVRAANPESGSHHMDHM